MDRDRPFNGKSRNSWFLSQDVPSNFLNDGFRGRLIVEFFGVVFVVHVVSNTDKLPAVIAAGEKYHRHA